MHLGITRTKTLYTPINDLMQTTEVKLVQGKTSSSFLSPRGCYRRNTDRQPF